eukprot:1319306-Amorphochlora_amoeboformis.AAC.1
MAVPCRVGNFYHHITTNLSSHHHQSIITSPPSCSEDPEKGYSCDQRASNAGVTTVTQQELFAGE